MLIYNSFVRMLFPVRAAPFGFVTSTQRVTSSPGVLDLPALLISLLVMSLLVYGVRESARFNNVMVFIKVGVVLFVIILGSFLVDTENWSPFAPFGWLGVSFFGKALPGQHRTAEGHGAGMLAGASLVFFSFLGFDSVSCQAEEARKPSRDLPVGILLSLAIATALYIGVSLVITGMVPYQEINIRAPLSSAFGQRGFHWAQYLIATGAVVGILSVLLVTMLSQPRIFMAMARDGLLPPFFASVHPRFKTPWKGTILTGRPSDSPGRPSSRAC
jgi:APA family basic amino acid/polyamine antiporter